ncbi:CBS domain-containing protein [Bacteriovorax sp. Seq25_V]|uniref:CBS domain-containing protein n=1 Tax=Bacteriovorax sp. Seq25_V TaxID=1201288 RepID=UPI00038A5227|nr:CBS domain-containing protein [Bacteriovorax sp. Seq25_V]EQC47411.1 CBS domain protein [Bacteriovorax sp. Seq25_V]
MAKLPIDLITEASNADKFLKMCAKDIMQKYPVTISGTTSIKSAITTLSVQRLSSICVVNNANTILGIVSEYDLLIQSASKDINKEVSYTKNVITVNESDNLKEVLLKILKNKLKIIPVITSRGVLVGMISRIDLLKELTEI